MHVILCHTAGRKNCSRCRGIAGWTSSCSVQARGHDGFICPTTAGGCHIFNLFLTFELLYGSQILSQNSIQLLPSWQFYIPKFNECGQFKELSAGNSSCCFSMVFLISKQNNFWQKSLCFSYFWHPNKITYKSMYLSTLEDIHKK